MRVFPRRRHGFAALACAVLFAAGCGSSSSSSAPPSGQSAPSSSQSAPAATPAPTSKPAPSTAAPSAAPAAPATATFTVGFPAFSGTFTPLYVAAAQGFFKENGVNVVLHRLPGSGSEMAALQSGSVQLVMISPDTALPAIAKGIHAVIVGVGVPYSPWTIWAKPSIKTLKDLEGHTLGLERVNSAADITVHQFLPKLGVNLSKVKLDYLGNPTTAAAGLISGKVDAVTVTPPSTIKLSQQGFRLLYDFRTTPYASEVFAVMAPYASSHASAVEGFLKSWSEAIAFIHSSANQSQVEKDLGTYIHSTDKTVLSGTVSYYQNVMRCLPTISPSDLSTSVSWAKSHAHQTIDASAAIDATYVDAISTAAKAKWCPGG